ncbi:MAG: AMP-binding protein [Rhodoferax sp.]
MNWLAPSFANNLAVVPEDGAPISYAELAQRVQAAADSFAPRALVFCLLDNSPDSLIGYLGALHSGAVPLLLNAGLGEAALAALLAAYAPRYVFLREDAQGAAAPGAVVARIGAFVLLERSGVEGPAVHADLALLLATSGSTGSPRLVRLSECNLRANARSIATYLNLHAGERAITTLPMAYSYGLSVIHSHLLVGASIVLTNRSLVDPGFWPLVRERQVSSLAGVPYSYEMLLKLRLERLAMPSVRTLTQAGGRLAPEKISAVHAACQRKGIRFIPMYGQTEATARIAYLPSEWVEQKPASIGSAIPGGRLWLEDDAGRRVDTLGDVGELVYSGENVSLGYAESGQDLVRGDDNLGVLRTGDLAVCDADGHYTLVGRKKRFIKVMGIRVSLDDAERLLAHEGVEAAVTGFDDRVIVAVVGDSPQEQGSEALPDQVARWLGVHRSVVHVRHWAALPRLDNGKTDYRALQEAA